MQSALQKTEIKTNMSLWKRVASRVPGAALWILAQLFKKTTHANESTDSDPYDYTLNLTTRNSTSATSTAASKPSATSTPAITPKGQSRTDVDACKETFQQWAVDPPLRLQLINCTRLHRAERDLQGDVVHTNGFSYVVNDE